MIALKAAIDRNRKPGRFLLTGSANIMTLPHISETLAGRVDLITISPLTRSEIFGYQSCIIPILANQDPTLHKPRTREALINEAQIGGFPEMLRRATTTSRARWFSSYIETTITREVREITQFSDSTSLFRLLQFIASRSSEPRNIEALSHDSGIPASTLRRLLVVLETTFFVASIPAWFTNTDKRLTKQPKLLLLDSGLYSHVLGGTPPPGPLLEQFVGCELQRLLTSTDERITLYHYRTQRGAETDWVIE